MRTVGALVVGLLLAWSAVAGAQPHTPGFATIDRFDDRIKADFAVSMVGFDAEFLGDIDQETFRFDFYGQYVTPGGFGGYAMLAGSYASISGNVLGFELEDSGWGASNIELGALYALRGRSFDTMLRGGLTLPTATEDPEADEIDANVWATFSRPTDAVMHPADTSVLRVSASPIIHHGDAYFRIDAGLDVPIDDGASGDSEGLHTTVRLNLGAGIETGGVALMGELVNLATTEDEDELQDDQDRFVHFLGFGARYLGRGHGGLQPSLALMLPLDDDFDQIADYVLIFGVQYVAPGDSSQ